MPQSSQGSRNQPGRPYWSRRCSQHLRYRARGGSSLQLTDHAADDIEPTWSPEGSLIAFTSSRDDTKDIYAMTPTGIIRDWLTDSPADDFHPA